TDDGKQQVYVRSYANPNFQRQISTEGGREPVWARNGRELFYRNGNLLMAVDVLEDPVFTPCRPHQLFPVDDYMISGVYAPNFDVTKDGHFVMVKLPYQRQNEFHLLLNWFRNDKKTSN